MKSAWIRRGSQLLFVAVICLLWQGLVNGQLISSQLLPAPTTVFVTLLEIMQTDDVLNGLLVTGFEVMIAMIVITPIAILLGMFSAERPKSERIFAPFAQFGTAVPQSIFLPVFIFVFGVGFLQKVVFGATHALFVIMLNSASAAKSVPSSLTQTARFYGASGTQIYSKIYFPYMLPLLLQGVRLGFVLCVTGVLIAEMYISRVGIGNLLNIWGASYDLPRLMAGIVLVGGLTIFFNELLRGVENRLGRWRQNPDSP